MKITELLHILGLEEQKSDLEIYSATVIGNRIEEGDLFIGDNKEDIETAINNKATAIIHDLDHEFTSNDTMMIQVKSAFESGYKLLRHIVKNRDVSFYLLGQHELTFFKMITAKNSVAFIPNDWKKAFEIILNSNAKDFIGTDEKILKNLNPKIQPLGDETFGYNVDDTLFCSTINVNKYLYQAKKLVPFHIDHLLRTLALCEKLEINYSLERLNYTKHLYPIYLQGEITTNREDENDKVVILSDNLDDIYQARDYIKHKAAWLVKNQIFVPLHTTISKYDHAIKYKDTDHLIQQLKAAHFNYAFVLGGSPSLEGIIKELMPPLRSERT